MSTGDAIRVTLEQDGEYGFHVRFDGTGLDPLLTDEPAPLGAGRGPNPPRLLLAAIANCLSASLLFALRKHRNAPAPVKATISATPVRNAEGRWRIPRADVEIQLAENNADYRDLERVIAQFEEFCVVTQSVRDGIDVEVTVRDGHGHVLLGDKSFEAGA